MDGSIVLVCSPLLLASYFALRPCRLLCRSSWFTCRSCVHHFLHLGHVLPRQASNAPMAPFHLSETASRASHHVPALTQFSNCWDSPLLLVFSSIVFKSLSHFSCPAAVKFRGKPPLHSRVLHEKCLLSHPSFYGNCSTASGRSYCSLRLFRARSSSFLLLSQHLRTLLSLPLCSRVHLICLVNVMVHPLPFAH